MRATLGSKQWLQDLVDTGIWDDERRWTDDAALRARVSPRLVAAAREALSIVYPPKTVKRIARHPRALPLLKLLCNPFALYANPLFGYGLDLADAWEHVRGDLLASLRHVDQVDGARYELMLAAGAARDDLPLRFQPNKRRVGSKPDFLVELDRRRWFLEAKRSQPSHRYRFEYEQYLRLLLLGEGGAEFGGTVHATRQYLELLEVLTERELAEAQTRLCVRVREARERLAASSSFPAVEIVDNYIEVRFDRPPHAPDGGFHGPIPTVPSREASRLLQSVITRAAGQLARWGPGVALVEINEALCLTDAVPAVEEWFAAEGSLYPDLDCVALHGLAYFDGDFRPWIDPVWRPDFGVGDREAAFWRSLATAIDPERRCR